MICYFSNIIDKGKYSISDAVFYPVFCLMNEVNYEIIFEKNNKVEMNSIVEYGVIKN